MSKYIGDFPRDAVVTFEFNVFDANDEPAAFSGAGSLTGSVEIYKSGTSTPHTLAYTPTVLDSLAGVYRLEVDMNHAFFEVGKNYAAILTGANIEAGSGKSVTNTIIRSWSCEARTALIPDGAIDTDTFAADTLSNDTDVATAVATELGDGAAFTAIPNAVVEAMGVTVVASGTPTTTSVQVENRYGLTNTQADNALILHLSSGAYSRITNIDTGTDTITISPALPAAPSASDKLVIFGQYLASL